MSSSPSSSSSGNGSHKSNAPSRPLDPISRTALRYTLSPREYELLHEYLISRAPKRVQQQTPTPKRFEKITGQQQPPTPKTTPADSTAAGDGSEGLDDNVTALRSALRTFVAVYVGFKGYEVAMRKLAERRGKQQPQTPTVKFANVRVALSFSTILLFHKLLHRFFRRLRYSLLEPTAAPFRRRNPQIAKLLTSPTTPAVGAALSGLALGLSPADQLRMTIAIYVLARSLEFSYNALEESGYLWTATDEASDGKGGRRRRPWWFGSWLLMPFACAQLLHAFVFDRDCFPADYGNFIMKRSPEYIQLRPPDYHSSSDMPWPGTTTIVDALAELSKLHWPPFISPILYPDTKDTLLPPLLAQKISPVTAPAHPAITHTSCALLHPRDPSCLRTYIKYFIGSFPNIVRFFTIFYSAFSILGYKALLKEPLPFLNKLSARILRMSLFVTGAIGTSWASICFFNSYLPRHILPTQRWILGGFAGGMWAWVARFRERGTFLYSTRLSVDSFWKVGKKRGWWRGFKNGDVLVFVASLMLVDYVYQVRPEAVRGGTLRKGMGGWWGEGFVDRVGDEGKEGEKEKGE